MSYICWPACKTASLVTAIFFFNDDLGNFCESFQEFQWSFNDRDPNLGTCIRQSEMDVLIYPSESFQAFDFIIEGLGFWPSWSVSIAVLFESSGDTSL